MFIAHRGLFNEQIRENTISAFDNAFNNGYDGIELDVRLTKDNIPVIIHDSFLSRVSNGKGLVKEYTYNELAKLNFGITKKEKIAKLEDVLTKYQNRIIIIELKEKIDITKYLNNQNEYYICSFNYNHIKEIPTSKNYKRGIISYGINKPKDYQKLDFIMILDTFSFSNIIKNYEENRLEVIIYGVVGNINNYHEKIKYVI